MGSIPGPGSLACLAVQPKHKAKKPHYPPFFPPCLSSAQLSAGAGHVALPTPRSLPPPGLKLAMAPVFSRTFLNRALPTSPALELIDLCLGKSGQLPGLSPGRLITALCGEESEGDDA